MSAWTCRFLLYRGARVLAGRTGAVAAADSCLFQSVRTVKTTTWWEEHLTEDNKSYMRKSLGEEYNRQIAAKLHPLKDEPWPRQEWTKESRRVGLVAVKLGMAPVWTKTGERHVVTMLQVQDCHVLNYLSKEEYDGHTAALMVGGKNASPFYKTDEEMEMFRLAGVPPKQKVTTFKVSDNAIIKPGIYTHHHQTRYIHTIIIKPGKCTPPPSNQVHAHTIVKPGTYTPPPSNQVHTHTIIKPGTCTHHHQTRYMHTPSSNQVHAHTHHHHRTRYIHTHTPPSNQVHTHTHTTIEPGTYTHTHTTIEPGTYTHTHTI
uniref:Large ribosomal subunit protein uL3m n=1 Tax=Oncorhynchus tshawytscha TaxID=74940 RepID=A0A8C8C5J0_ONCTS